MAEQSVNIKIAAHVQIGEMRKMEDALQREIVQMRLAGAEAEKLAAKEKSLANIRSKIAGESRGMKIKAAFSEAAMSVPGVGPIMSAMNGSALAVGAGIAAVGAGFRLLSDSVKEFAAAEVAVAKLDAALGNSGLLDGKYRSELQAFAGDMQQLTGISDESWLDVFATLTKFGADQSNIRSYTQAVVNLAGMMGGDVTQAAFIFGKAMQGSTEMLGRYGITVDKAKSQSEQLADIMRQLEMRGGGQLEGMANTIEGRTRKIAEAWGNVKEGIGRATLSLTDFLAKLIGQKDTGTYLENFSNGLNTMAGWFGETPNTSGAKNKTVLTGDTPEAQAQAGQLDRRRKALAVAREGNAAELERLKQDSSNLARPAMAAAAGMSGVRVPESQADEKGRLAAKAKIDAKIAEIEQQNAVLDWAEKDINDKMAAAGVRAVPQAEADKMAEIRALREGTVEFGPGGNPEDRENAKEAAKNAADKEASLAAKREELQLELAIAEAKAAGDKDAEARLKWQKDYNRMLEDGKAAGMTADEAAGFAARGANAATGPGTNAPAQPGVAVQAGSQAQTLARLAGMAIENAKEKGIDAVAKNTETMLRKFDDLIGAVKETDKGVFTP